MEEYQRFDPTSIGLEKDFRLTKIAKYKG